MILDTNFLVALEREIRRREEGPASRFLAASVAERFCITPIIAGEMACGVSLSARSAQESLLLPFEMLALDSQAAWMYGTLYRTLASGGVDWRQRSLDRRCRVGICDALSDAQRRRFPPRPRTPSHPFLDKL